MTARDPWAERYNRRTRAMEKQARAAVRIAEALELLATAAVAGTRVGTPDGRRRVWTEKYAKEVQDSMSERERRMR